MKEIKKENAKKENKRKSNEKDRNQRQKSYMNMRALYQNIEIPPKIYF